MRSCCVKVDIKSFTRKRVYGRRLKNTITFNVRRFLGSEVNQLFLSVLDDTKERFVIFVFLRKNVERRTVDY